MNAPPPAHHTLSLPAVDGVITAAEVAASAQHLLTLQTSAGMIPWWPGGHCDPWNHVEAAMALDVAGHHDAARPAYDWLADIQRDDGSWHNYYLPDGDRDDTVEDAKLDTNVCAYVATGALHHVQCAPQSERASTAAALWPMVDAALGWVLDQRRSDGLVLWAVEADDRPWDYALLTGTASIQHSLRSGAHLAAEVGYSRANWVNAADVMAATICERPSAFADKSRWAMDWYYPVLTGAIRGAAASDHLLNGWSTFVMDGLGVRCVSDEDWITASETAEASMAFAAIGLMDHATDLLAWTRGHRRHDGAYWTGIAHPNRITFPAEEHSSYTAAAVILAADAIVATSPAARLFSHTTPSDQA